MTLITEAANADAAADAYRVYRTARDRAIAALDAAREALWGDL